MEKLVFDTDKSQRDGKIAIFAGFKYNFKRQNKDTTKCYSNLDLPRCTVSYRPLVCLAT